METFSCPDGQHVVRGNRRERECSTGKLELLSLLLHEFKRKRKFNLKIHSRSNQFVNGRNDGHLAKKKKRIQSAIKGIPSDSIDEN